MNILIVNQHVSENLGGSEMQCDLIASGLALIGHNVTYGAIGKKDSPVPKSVNYPIVRLALGGNRNLDEVLDLSEPDVIYWRYNKKQLYYFSKKARARGIPFVFAVSHNRDLKKYSYQRRPADSPLGSIRSIISCVFQALRSRYNYQGLKLAESLTSLNRSYTQLSPVKDSITIWNATDNEKIPFSWPKPYVCWVANITARKNPDLFMFLAEKLSSEFPEYDFVMVGGLKHVYYKSMIEKIDNELPAFHYIGPKTPAEVNGILANATLLVHTCEPEGFGNNFIQAWKQGTPTVSLKFDPDGLIKQEKLGYVANGSLQDLIVKTSNLLEDSNTRDEMGERAQQFALNNFTSERMVKELEVVLLRAASTGGA